MASIAECHVDLEALAASLSDRSRALAAVGSGAAGVAELHAHHGEILQGVFYDSDDRVEQGLVTLPCSLYRTRVTFRPLCAGPLTVEPGDRARARVAARLALDAVGRTGWGGSVRIDSNVPLGWGCGSSTTDVVTTIRAVADAFGVALPAEWIAMLAVTSEIASDSLMYGSERAVLFAQRRGRLLRDLGGPLPLVHVLGFNTEVDSGVATLSLLPCKYSGWEVEAFQSILGLLCRAVDHQDPRLLGCAATASAEINQRHRPKRFLPQLRQIASHTGAVGLQVAHSGTVAGLLFEPGSDAAQRIDDARTMLRRLGLQRSWEFNTDPFSQEDSGEHRLHQCQRRGCFSPAAPRVATREPDWRGFPADETAAGAVHPAQGDRGGGPRAGRLDRRVHLGDVWVGAGNGGQAARTPAHAGE